MNALEVNIINLDVVANRAKLSLIKGEIPCGSVVNGYARRGIVSDGVTGISVGDELVEYSDSTGSSLHEMIVAGYLLKAGVSVEGRELVCAEGSALVLFSASTFVWSARNTPIVTWVGNDRCRILQMGQSHSERRFDSAMDSTFHLRSEALVLMQPGAELTFQKKQVWKAQNRNWRKLIPFINSQPKPDIEFIEETRFQFSDLTLK